RQENDESRNRKRPARTEFVADHAAEKLKQRIGYGEGGISEAELRVVQPELVLHQGRGDLKIRAVDEEEKIHRAQECEHDSRRREPQSDHAWGRVSPLIWVRCMMRRVLSSKASRRCMVQRLSHSTRSPARQELYQVYSSRVAWLHTSSSS